MLTRTPVAKSILPSWLGSIPLAPGCPVYWVNVNLFRGLDERHGAVAPPDFLAQLRPFNAIFLGAVGWPAKLPDNITLWPLIQIRQSFDQWACVRPARTFRGVRSLLAGNQSVNLVVVRENSEGEYVDVGGRFHASSPEEFAVQSAVHTRRGIERALRFGFGLARQRRHRLSLATKSNAQRHAFVLWDEILEQIAPESPISSPTGSILTPL